MKLSVVVAGVALALLVAAASAQCTVQTPFGVVDLTQIPVATLEIENGYDGAMYEWVISLCQAVNQPPADYQSCAYASFVSEYSYSTDGCADAWTTPMTGWSYSATYSAATTSFSSPDGSVAAVYVGCGYTLQLQSTAAVQPFSNGGVLTYPIMLSSSALCAGAPTVPPASCVISSPNGPVNLSQIPVTLMTINQTYQGVVTPFNFVISLCQAVNFTPVGASACASAGFVSEYSPLDCETTWATQTLPWAYSDAVSSAMGVFVNNRSWPLTVILTCGTTLDLHAAGDVQVSSTMSFVMRLTSSVLCFGPPPPPLTPTPATSAPPVTTPPSPSTGQLVQSVCSDPQCASCHNSTMPLKVCVPQILGGSLIAACSASAAILTVFPFSSTCTGASNVTQLPLNQCVAEGGAGGGYVKNTCTAFKSAH